MDHDFFTVFANWFKFFNPKLVRNGKSGVAKELRTKNYELKTLPEQTFVKSIVHPHV